MPAEMEAELIRLYYYTLNLWHNLIEGLSN